MSFPTFLPAARRWLLLTVALLCSGAVSTPPAHAQSTAARAEDVKAAFLINFGRFTEWPDEALGSPDQPFVIAVLGADSVARALDAAARDRRIQDHPILVRLVRAPEDLTGIHLLFAATFDEVRWEPALADLRTRPVLTVGDELEFARRRGIAAFFVERERIRFAIHRPALGRAGLRMNSRLLNLALLLEEDPR